MKPLDICILKIHPFRPVIINRNTVFEIYYSSVSGAFGSCDRPSFIGQSKALYRDLVFAIIISWIGKRDMRWGEFNDIRGARSLVFYVLLRFTAFYYPFGFFKLLLCSLERISANINEENKLIIITSKGYIDAFRRACGRTSWLPKRNSRDNGSKTIMTCKGIGVAKLHFYFTFTSSPKVELRI